MSDQKKTYTSPKHKLLSFFERSRDKWKAKSIEATATIKGLKNRIHFLEQSKLAWKEKAEQRAAEVAELKARLAEAARKLAEEEKEEAPETPPSTAMSLFEEHLPRHHYSPGEIVWFISLVTVAAVSLRGSAAAMAVSAQLLCPGLTMPSWSGGRLWLLRLGYYKLTRPKQKADDWLWIVDHQVEGGQEKCLIILGLRLSNLPTERCLTHADLEPIDIIPVTHSDGKVVTQQLKKSVRKTGAPRVIVSDHGADLKKGISDFCAQYPQTSFIYDIKHRTAALLKKELNEEPRWQEFGRRMRQTKQETQQTELSYLAPPAQRTKARYMNADTVIGWGSRVLGLLDRLAEEGRLKKHARLWQKLGWVTGYRAELSEWEGLLTTTRKTEKYVREKGYTRGCEKVLSEELPAQGLSPRVQAARNALLEFVEEEGNKAREGERLPGSSEVLESVIGKLKRIEGAPRGRGMSNLLLSVGAIVATTTIEVVSQAMKKVRTKEVLAWSKKMLGKTQQAKRREAFSLSKTKEQKADQLPLIA